MDFETREALRAELQAQRKLSACILESIMANVNEPHLAGWKDGYAVGLKMNIKMADLALDYFNK